jgi:hypothetical protein
VSRKTGLGGAPQLVGDGRVMAAGAFTLTAFSSDVFSA